MLKFAKVGCVCYLQQTALEFPLLGRCLAPFQWVMGRFHLSLSVLYLLQVPVHAMYYVGT